MEQVAALQAVGDDWKQIEARSEALRQSIECLVLPSELERSLHASYARLCEAAGVTNVSVAVRSSATTEDTQAASFAGQHSTELNQVGAAAVVSSVKKCWASAFNARACEYRNKQQIPHIKALMAVAVQVSAMAFHFSLFSSLTWHHTGHDRPSRQRDSVLCRAWHRVSWTARGGETLLLLPLQVLTSSCRPPGVSARV
jgi:hypothetical protein